MLKTALFTALIVGFSSNAIAVEAPKYDRKIEAAVKKIIANKVGDIRGGLDAEAKAVFADYAVEVPVSTDVAVADNKTKDLKLALLSLADRPSQIAQSKYQSGRPEPLRAVRKISSFQYF